MSWKTKADATAVETSRSCDPNGSATAYSTGEFFCEILQLADDKLQPIWQPSQA